MKQYHDLLKSILVNGKEHRDRTGVGTLSHFGFQTRFDLREGFPIVTTKKVPFRWIAEELFWFLSGNTNESDLRAKGVDIWAEWADEEHTRRFNRERGDLGHTFYEIGSSYQQRQLAKYRRIRENFGLTAYVNVIHSFSRPIPIQTARTLPNGLAPL